MKKLKRLRDRYVIWHARGIQLPSFPQSTIVRQNVVFIGRVQKVGFRLEICCLAERIGVTGWVKNRDDGSVEAEFQGMDAQIDFIVASMKSLKRARVKNIIMEEALIDEGSQEFTMLV